MLVLFDHKCRECGHVFEELVDRSHPDPVKCPQCNQLGAERLISGTRIDPKLGCDPAYPTLYDAWARKHRQAAQIERKRKLSHGEDR